MNKIVLDNKFIASASILLIGMYVIFLNPYIDVRGFNAHDPAGYINKAFSLWQGVGYGEQFADIFLPVTAQPFGFSLLLAPLVGFVGVNFMALKLFMLFFAGVFSVALYKFFGYFLESKEQATYATLMMMASPIIFGLSHRVLADVPLFIFVVLGLLILDQYIKRSVPIFSRELLLSVIVVSAAYLLKQTGVAIFVGVWALFLHPNFRNKTVLKKLLVFTMMALIPILAWHAWCKSVPDDLWYWTTPNARDYFWKNPFTAKDGYLPFSDFVVRVRHNLVWGISNNIGMIFIAPLYFLEGSLVGFLLASPIVVCLIWQWGKSFIQRPSVLEGFVFFSLALLIPKYLGMASRYVAIIWPALLIYASRGVAFIPRKIKIYLFSSLIVISITTTFIVSWDQWKNPYGSKTLKDYVLAAQEAKKLFPDTSVCKAPLMSHWQVLSGHKCQYQGRDLVSYFVSLSDSAPQNLDAYQDIERDALKGAQAVGSLWQSKSGTHKVYENDNFALFQVVSRGN